MKHLRASSVRSSAIGVESILMKPALLIWVIFGAAFFSYPILAMGLKRIMLLSTALYINMFSQRRQWFT